MTVTQIQPAATRLNMLLSIIKSNLSHIPTNEELIDRLTSNSTIDCMINTDVGDNSTKFRIHFKFKGIELSIKFSTNFEMYSLFRNSIIIDGKKYLYTINRKRASIPGLKDSDGKIKIIRSIVITLSEYLVTMGKPNAITKARYGTNKRIGKSKYANARVAGRKK